MAFRFKNFRVYKDSKEFLKFCTLIIESDIKKKHPDLASQISRALASIILNIAEGSGGESDIEFARFISIAIKSTYEVVAGFDVALALNLTKPEVQTEVEKRAEQILKELNAFRRTLKEKSIKDKI